MFQVLSDSRDFLDKVFIEKVQQERKIVMLRKLMVGDEIWEHDVTNGEIRIGHNEV